MPTRRKTLSRGARITAAVVAASALVGCRSAVPQRSGEFPPRVWTVIELCEGPAFVDAELTTPYPDLHLVRLKNSSGGVELRYSDTCVGLTAIAGFEGPSYPIRNGGYREYECVEQRTRDDGVDVLRWRLEDVRSDE